MQLLLIYYNILHSYENMINHNLMIVVLQYTRSCKYPNV